MTPHPTPPGLLNPEGTTASSVELFHRARRGDREAVDQLFARLAPGLFRWARGRLPHWARRGTDTADVVQDALVQTFRRLDQFEPRRRRALQAYLRQAVRNRILDHIRKAGRFQPVDLEEVELVEPKDGELAALAQENAERCRQALATLDEEERELIVARLEMGYSYEQLALAFGRPSPDAARMAVKRALLRLAERVSPD
jgi:RNA polymerase sigma factor (sigma-70 family)